MSFGAPREGAFFLCKKQSPEPPSVASRRLLKSGDGRKACDAFGARSDVRKNCGLSFAVFAFSQSFVRYNRGQIFMVIYLGYMGRQ